MICPLCKVEAKISKASNIFRKEKLFKRFEYSCRNKDCENYDKPIGDEEVEIDVTIEFE